MSEDRKPIERYNYLVDLQAECGSLVLGKSIKLTGLVMESDAIESSILLLQLIKSMESLLQSKEALLDKAIEALEMIDKKLEGAQQADRTIQAVSFLISSQADAQKALTEIKEKS